MLMEHFQLSEASGIDFSRLVTLTDMKAAGADVEMMLKCENLLKMWCKAIDQVQSFIWHSSHFNSQYLK